MGVRSFTGMVEGYEGLAIALGGTENLIACRSFNQQILGGRSDWTEQFTPAQTLYFRTLGALPLPDVLPAHLGLHHRWR